MTPTLALEKLRAALEAGPTPEWRDAREPNGRGMGWSTGPDAWLGADSYSEETAAAAALIAACSPLTIRALLDELEACKEALRQADSVLRVIEEQDAVENCLDPQWATRIAKAARAALNKDN